MEIDTLKYPFSTTIYFIPEFVTRMRKSGQCSDKPSSRQSITMSRMLLPTYLKKGYLSFDDLMDASVLTSRVENQSLAERIASDILLGVTESKDAKPRDDQPLAQLVSPKDLNNAKHERGDGSDEYLQTDIDSEVDVLGELSRKPDLGVGPGEDELLKSDVRAIVSNIDEEARKALQEILRNLLLRLGREYEKKLERFRTPSLRPYEPFEDPDRIDEDRSLENIFEQGKRIDQVRYDDFLMREKENRKRTIIYIQDVSNTMFYTLDGINSIQYSIMCLAPLIYAMRRERHGLVLYESNSHVLKGLADEVDDDKLVDVLLSLVGANTMDVEKRIGGTAGSHTWGGTVPNMSLKWATNELLEVDDRSDKICFLFSDFVLDDIGSSQPGNSETYLAIKELMGNGVRVAACVSPLAHGELFNKYTRTSLSRIRALGCEVIEAGRPREFLDKVMEFIEAR